MNSKAAVALVCVGLGTGGLFGCAGGSQEAAAMPTPILCKTILDLTPVYVRYNEYLSELKKRGEDCSQYLGDTQNVRIR